MKLFRPVLTNILSQGFGQNKSCAKETTFPYVIKTKTEALCPPGYVDFYTTLGMVGHNGYDHVAWHGEPVYHCADFNGWMKSERDVSGGIGVDVVSKEPLLICDECGEKHYIKIRYWHGKQVIGWDGKNINTGDCVMLADSTGASSGDHLHWSPKWCDQNGVGIHKDNGFYGAINPTAFYEDTFVLDYTKTIAEAITAIGLANKIILQTKLFLKKYFSI